MKPIPFLNKSNIYAIPAGSYFDRDDKDIYLLYSPLAESAIIALPENIIALEDCMAGKSDGDEDTKESLKALLDYIPWEQRPKKPLSPDSYTKLSILPNLMCNFSCSYCYSAKGRSSKELDFGHIRPMLDYFMDPNRLEERKLSIFFAGGGEPVLSWPLLEESIIYADKLAREHGFSMYYKIITNGAVINNRMIDFIKKYSVHLCVSFDILKDVQNAQRGSFQLVAHNIKTLIENGVNPSISATITKSNVNRMPEMADVLNQDFPEINNLNFDPVMDKSSFESVEDLKAFYETFVKNYFLVHETWKNGDRGFNCTIRDKADVLAERYCPGFLCLTPEGTISICHKLSSEKEEGFEAHQYGRIGSSGKIEFDLEKYISLMQINVHKYEKCTDCFAKWHCAGGCMSYRNHFGEEMMDAVCHFHLNFFREIILRRLNAQMLENTGQSLKETVLEAL